MHPAIVVTKVMEMMMVSYLAEDTSLWKQANKGPRCGKVLTPLKQDGKLRTWRVKTLLSDVLIHRTKSCKLWDQGTMEQAGRTIKTLWLHTTSPTKLSRRRMVFLAYVFTANEQREASRVQKGCVRRQACKQKPRPHERGPLPPCWRTSFVKR
jgi:hypothetical protein